MLSVVIPVLNEVESLETLHGELTAVAAARGLDVEILFVDDGSTDGSWEVLRKLAQGDPRVRAIRFRRNFGKAAALAAAFRAVRGDYVVTLDADLQDDPAEIPNFLAKLEQEKLDCISGWKKVRHDPWHKVGPSRVFNWLVGWLTGVRLHDHNCGMKFYRTAVVREIRLYGEMHRFIPVLADARGFKVGELVIQHRARKFGRSKYGIRRFLRGFLDLLTVKFLTGFGQRPSHLLGGIGLLSVGIGLVGLLYLAAFWLVQTVQGLDPGIGHRPLLLYSLGALLFGGQLVSVGFIAELITAYSRRESDSYSVAERTYDGDEPEPSRDRRLRD